MMEFTWTHGSIIESGEFRHGPLEVVEDGVPFVFLLGTDESRHTTERAINFVKRHDQDVIVIDYADISQGLHPMLAPFVLFVPMEWFSYYLAIYKDHNPDDRRYYGGLVEYQNVKHEIQINFCTNLYCGWFGLPQKRFEAVKSKPFRYKLVGSNNDGKAIECNPDPKNPNGFVGGCFTTPMSNWSVADEIARLAQNNTVRDVEPAYEFHREDCKQIGITPFDSTQAFYRRGTSSAKSQKWQCKVCKKITNVGRTDISYIHCGLCGGNYPVCVASRFSL